MTKLVPSRRASAALALVVAGSIGGYATYGGYRVHDDVAFAAQYLVQPWEGRKLVAYLDQLAKPPVWTICDGDTTGVTPGMRETPQGCDKRLMAKMEKNYRPPLAACIPAWDGRPLSWRGMMISLSWNIGPDKVCDSTAARIVKEAARKGVAPDYYASCVAATAYNRAGGQVYIGLVNRRGMGDKTRIGEGEACVSGLEGPK